MQEKENNIQKLYFLSDILGKPLTVEELNSQLKDHNEASACLEDMKQEYRDKLMEFLLGNKGLAVTYDFVFRKIMNPEFHPDRVEALISAILGKKVKIRKVLPLEGDRLSETGGNVVMDIRVELEDGSIVDVEIQKIGNKFPGERIDCYLSDVIMRQYNYEKARRKKKFSYRDMHPVILIVIMEESTSVFHALEPEYIHRGTRTFDTGVKVKSLTDVVLICLDIFYEQEHNVDKDLEAWLTFLSSDDTEKIMTLVNRYPEFLQYYREIAEFRRKPEELIMRYSEALAIMDRNSLQESYEDIMMYKMEKKMKAELAEKMAEKEAELAEKMAEKDKQLAEKDEEIASLKKQIKSEK